MPFSVFIPCKYLSADFVISNAKFFHFSRKATATQEPGSDDFKIEKKSAADLDKYDKLPEGVYASSHPERLAKYVEFLTSVDAEK